MKLALMMLFVAGAAGNAFTQDAEVRMVEGPGDPGETFTLPLPPPPGMMEGGPDGPAFDEDVVVLFAHDGGESRLVKGAPYQADAVTEITQHLADGNKIVRKSTSSVARDSDGRIRREGGLAALGPLPGGDKPLRHVFIHDPVAGVAYMLDPEEKVARKLPKPGDGARGMHPMPPMPPAPPMPPMHGGDVFFEKRVEKRAPKGEPESLGTQTIEGVEVEGTRRRSTIPAGEIGNERPIETVSERWYSKELQTVVLSKRSDPRMGETVYRLEHLSRSEPDRALFEVPSDYTVKEGGPMAGRRRIIREKP